MDGELKIFEIRLREIMDSSYMNLKLDILFLQLPCVFEMCIRDRDTGNNIAENGTHEKGEKHLE